jgi:fibronectin type 3 domain-containing protein
MIRTHRVRSRRLVGALFLAVAAVVAPACGGGGGGGGGNTGPQVPGAPTTLQATAGEALVALSWAAPGAGAQTYSVKRGTASGGPYATVVTGLPTTSFTNTGLTDGTLYYFVVTATNAVGEGAASIQASATPAAAVSAPAAPTGLVATTGMDHQVALSWNAVTGAATYTVKRNTVSGGETALVAGTAINTTTFTDATALNGTQYFYVVVATNSVGTSGNSNEVNATPALPASAPAAPTGLSATGGLDAHVPLTWNAVPGATSYTVKRGTATGVYGTTFPGLVSTSYDDTALANGTQYFYVVIAVNTVGPSPNSAEVTATPVTPVVVPSAPTGLVATGGNGHIDLSWNASPGATSYRVLTSLTTGTEVALVSGVAATIYTDSAVTNGTAQFYTVQAHNAAGFSASSNEATATPVAPPAPPTTPSGLAAANVGTTINLTWTASTGTAPITYNIQRNTTGSTTVYTQIATNVAAANYSDVGLTDGTTYYYSVTASNPGGVSALATQATATIVPIAPTGVVCTPGDAQNQISWNASAGATTYSVWRNTTGSTVLYPTVFSSIAGSPYTDTTAVNGQIYYYAVVAINLGGSSTQSSQVSGTPSGPPPAPTGVIATAGNAAIQLNWNASFLAATYKIYRSGTTGTEAFLAGSVIGTTFVDSTAVNGTQYFYKVSSVNGIGQEGPLSAEVNATASAAKSSAPSVVGVFGNNQVQLTWTGVAGATTYTVYRSTTNGTGYAALAAGTGIGTTTFTDSTAVNGTTYYYVVVVATGAGGASVDSNQTTETPALPPAAPTGLAANTTAASQVALTWTASAGAVSYNVMRGTSTGTETFLANTASTNYTDSSGTNGTTYFYEVTALSSAIDISAASNEVSATPNPAPTLLSFVPTTAATNVMVDANLVLTFSGPMNKASVQSKFSMTGGVQYVPFWDTAVATPTGTVMTIVFDTVAPFGTITFDDLLTENTLYTWNLAAGSTSATGQAMLVAPTDHFTTIIDATQPVLTGSKTNVDADLNTRVTATATDIILTFNKAMDMSAGNAQVQIQSNTDTRNANVGSPDTHMSVSWTDNKHLDISLTGTGGAQALNAGEGYQLATNNLRDSNGIYMNSNNQISFLVAATTVNLVKPTITGSVPSNGAVGVSRDSSIFIGLVKDLTPNVASKITVNSGGLIPALDYSINYQLGKNHGPQGVQITPLKAWPASQLVTFTITAAGGPTDAWGNAFASDVVISFTTGAGTANPIIIDAAYSSIKSSIVDADSFQGVGGFLMFKDSVSNARMFVDYSSLSTADITIADHTFGIPVKGWSFNQNGNNSFDILSFSRNNGSSLTGLLNGTQYDLTFHSTLKGSQGQTFAQTVYTFTTVASGGNTAPSFEGSINTQFQTNAVGPARTLQLNANASDADSNTPSPTVAISATVGTVDAGKHTWYVSFVAGATESDVSPASAQLTVGGATGVDLTGIAVGPGGVTARKIYRTVAGDTGLPKLVHTINDNTTTIYTDTSSDASLGATANQVTLTVTESSGGNSVNITVPSQNNGGGGFFNFQYQPQPPTNEAGLVTTGNHTLTWTLTDHVALNHQTVVNQDGYVFSNPGELTALTLTPLVSPTGPTPLYKWTGTTPASSFALLLVVLDNATGNQLFMWALPPTATQFQHPSDFPLAAGTYKWTLALVSAPGGTLRLNNVSQGIMAPQTFTK